MTQKTMTEKICFVVSPIGEPESEIRHRSDKVFKHIISPAVEPFGYKPLRADQIAEPGIITTQVIQHVVEAPLVIADLTGRNPNVFYELAIRHAIKKPLIQIIKKGENIPFDVAATRTVQVDIQDLDNVDTCKQEITNQIQNIEKGKGEIDTPISVALDLKILKTSENPEERSLGDIIEAITGLRTDILTIEKRFRSPESFIPLEYIEHIMKKVQNYPLINKELYSELRELIEQMTLISQVEKFNPDEIEILRERLGYFRRKLIRMTKEFA